MRKKCTYLFIVLLVSDLLSVYFFTGIAYFFAPIDISNTMRFVVVSENLTYAGTLTRRIPYYHGYKLGTHYRVKSLKLVLYRIQGPDFISNSSFFHFSNSKNT